MQQSQCKRCGTCCNKGGPILHKEDQALFKNGTVKFQDLVTIRAGEPTFNPFKERVESAPQEMLKIAGKGASWQCLFYDASQSACAIHGKHPLECRLLQCWDTKAIENISGRDCLCRYDLLDKDDPLRKYIDMHEQRCAYAKVTSLLRTLDEGQESGKILEQLTEIMQEDLAIREKAINLFSLNLQQELFYFGRPLFRAVHHPKVTVTIIDGSIQLKLAGT